jgi:hypothetical protein
MQGTNTDGGYIVAKLDAITDEAAAGFRLSRHVAKKTKDGTKKGLQESLAVFVPIYECAPFSAEFPAINVAMQDAFDSCVDRMIRAKLESGATVIYDADLTAQQLENFLASQPEGLGKLSADKIKAWFTESLSENLTAALTEKLGEQVTPEKLTQTLNSYRDIFARLAEKSPSFEPKVHENLQKAIALAEESAMTEKLAAKLLAAAQKSVDLLAL